jgi:hypothetical protein
MTVPEKQVLVLNQQWQAINVITVEASYLSDDALEPGDFSLVAAYLDLHSVGAYKDDTKVFMSTIVRIDAESLIGDLKGNPIACKPSHDAGHVGIFALGAINCAYDPPSIMAAISRRTKLGLGDCRAPAKNGPYQEHQEKHLASLEHDSLTPKLLQNAQILELSYFHYLPSAF